jgi:hypothetical protein
MELLISIYDIYFRRKFDEDTTVALKFDLTHTQQMISDEAANMNRLHILLNMIDQ